MPYPANKKIEELEIETTIADTDYMVLGDTSDSGRAKAITFANLKTEIVGDDTAFVRKTDYDANTILYATSDNTPVALTVGTNSVVGRVAGAITTLAIDSDLTSVSANDDTVPSAKATKTALDLKAVDADVVHDTGNETIAGVKTFSSDPLIPDEVYGSGWNGVLEPPTKNAVYDKIESLSGYNSSKAGTTTRDLSTASGNQTIAHGLGKTPSLVRLTVIQASTSGASDNYSFGTYDGSNTVGVYRGQNSNSQFYVGNSTTYAINIMTAATNDTSPSTASVTVDGTNITLAWTKATGASGTAYILWEVIG